MKSIITAALLAILATAPKPNNPTPGIVLGPSLHIATPEEVRRLDSLREEQRRYFRDVIQNSILQINYPDSLDQPMVTIDHQVLILPTETGNLKLYWVGHKWQFWNPMDSLSLATQIWEPVSRVGMMINDSTARANSPALFITSDSTAREKGER